MAEQEEKVYGVIGRLTVQILDLQETNSILTQQVHDLSNQLRIAQSQLESQHMAKKAPEEEEVHKDMPVDQAIALLRKKGIPVSIDGQPV